MEGEAVNRSLAKILVVFALAVLACEIYVLYRQERILGAYRVLLELER